MGKNPALASVFILRDSLFCWVQEDLHIRGGLLDGLTSEISFFLSGEKICDLSGQKGEE